MKELTFDEYELLSDDEKMKYVREMYGESTIEDVLKELKEVTESLRKKRIQRESFLINESLSVTIL
jgi:hypothetical protein